MRERYKQPTASDTVITELMIPAYANFGGKIHGGLLLSLMDKVAYACATKHSELYCVTVAVENVNFLAPVEVGELVHMMARVNYTGNSSMVVGIRVTAENVKEQVVKHTNTSYFTMVAKSDDGGKVQVPPLILDRRMHLSPKNPYFEHATFSSWVAYRNGKPVGRISAQIDQLHLEQYQNATGFFGMLEAENNSETFQALLATAENWLRKKGMRCISGPYNLSINQELGLLVNGFDTPPSMMMGHARPYYGDRLQENGYQKEKMLKEV